jgi:hypothetical protein
MRFADMAALDPLATINYHFGNLTVRADCKNEISMTNEEYTALQNRLVEIMGEKKRLKEECQQKIAALDKESAEIRARMPPPGMIAEVPIRPLKPGDSKSSGGPFFGKKP